MKNKKQIKKRSKFYSLTFRIVSYMFILMLVTMTIAITLMAIFYYSGIVDSGTAPAISPVLLIIILILISSLIGWLLSVALYSLTFKDLNEFQTAMGKVAHGDFSVSLPENDDGYMHDLNCGFNAMVKSLKSIETLKTDFISDFSHEFKTPIASIYGFAKLLKKGGLTEEERLEYIDIIITESNRLTRLAQNTLFMSRLETHETVYEKKLYSLDEQLRKCALMFQSEMDAKNIDLSLSGESVQYYGNEDLVQQMWINLISNAIKFTPSGGTVEISVTETSNRVIVSVRDSGIGMNEQTKQKIFDKFWQGDSSRAVAGNGLGLSIVNKILQLTDGKIEVKSKENEGSEFIVTLPNDIPEEKSDDGKNDPSAPSGQKLPVFRLFTPKPKKPSDGKPIQKTK